ncbi:conserved hypothetical protein [delta proteobacterium NaphS2]|nr:conserved hypothetical protein [delta proteobacterium NaphS2]
MEAIDGRFNKLVALREAIEREKKRFEEVNKPFSKAIDQLGTWRNEWLAEKQKWNHWQSVLLGEGDLAQLQPTFAKANDTIDKALRIVVSKLNAMLAAQERAGIIQTKIIALSTELETLILASRSDIRINISPPMFSLQYFSQFSNELWSALKKGLTEIQWPDSRFIEQHRLNVLLHVLLSLFVIFIVYRNRRMLNESKRWRVLAARPISMGFLFSTLALAWFYEHRIYQDVWGLTITVAAGVSYARIIGALNPAAWKVKFTYGLVIVLLATNLLQVIRLPMPLFRLYTVLTALAGLVFCWRWAGESFGEKDGCFYRLPLRAGAFFLAFIIVAEIWGKQGMAEFLFMCLIRSTALVLGFMFFVYMTRGFLEWLFRHSSLQRVAFFQKNTDTIIRRVTIFMDTACCRSHYPTGYCPQ